jgi:hypothetical protein
MSYLLRSLSVSATSNLVHSTAVDILVVALPRLSLMTVYTSIVARIRHTSNVYSILRQTFRADLYYNLTRCTWKG